MPTSRIKSPVPAGVEPVAIDARPPDELADVLGRFDCLVIGTRLEWAERLAALERLRTARDRRPVFLVTAERDESRATAADGTGFGLGIVNRIVEAHGWEIAATDGRDGGARFEITDVASPQ